MLAKKFNHASMYPCTIFPFSGQITNFAAIRTYVIKETGWAFTSETDTECIAKLAHLFYNKHPNQSFPEIVQQVCQVLVRK